MSSEKNMHLYFAPGEQQLLRYTVLSVSAVILVGTIVFAIWVLGQTIGALHALVFPLAIAGVLALVLYPIVEFFERRFHVSRLGAVVSLFFILIGLFAALMVLVVPTAIHQGSNFFESVPAIVERAHDNLSVQFPKALPILENAITQLDMKAILPEAEEAASLVMGYVGLLVGLSFVPLYLFFALLSGDHMKAHAKGALFLFTQKRRNDVLYMGQLFVDYVTAFFRGQLTIALIMGVMMAFGFTVVGLAAGIFFGLALGLLNIVPFLGAIVGVVTVLPVAYFQPEGGAQLVMLVLAVIAATQLVESMLLTPKIMSDRSGLHPAVVVISIIFWGTVLGGIVGMILAVPLTAFLLTLGAHMKRRLCASSSESDRAMQATEIGDNGHQT